MDKYIFWSIFIVVLFSISAILTTTFIGRDSWTVYSNLSLLIPAITAYILNHRLRMLIYTFMCIFSALYHICDSFEMCLFSYSFHHNLDFFFAEFLIILGGLYLIEFNPQTQYIEYWLIFTGAIVIVIFQDILPGELTVQAGITSVVFGGVIIYWIIYKHRYTRIPRYNWAMLTLGLSLTSGSIMLFSIQSVLHQGYWGIHSLWHIAAGLGQHFILLSKRKVPLVQTAASRIKFYF